MKRLFLIGPVTYEMYETFSKELAEAEKRNTPVLLEICSEGGDGDIGLALYGRIKVSHLKFKAIGHGCVNSAAIGPFMACEERHATPECVFLIHNSESKSKGDYRSHKIESDKLAKAERLWASLLSQSTGTQPEVWLDLSDNETYLSAKDAKVNNLVTKIVGVK